MYFNKELEV